MIDMEWTWWDTVTLPFHRAWYLLEERWYFYLVNRPHIVKLKIPVCAWMDKDHRMLHANMVLLEEYVEQEKPFEVLDFDYDDEHRKLKLEIEMIYGWWKNYDKRQEEIDNALHEWYDINKKNSKMKVTELPNGDRQVDREIVDPSLVDVEKKLFEKHIELENKLAFEEEDMLVRLMKIRKTLWT